MIRSQPNLMSSLFITDKFYHVPYRQSRLTMLMKDAFDIESHRHCKTVVFANVAPSVVDLAMTTNTLRYATPLRIGQSQRQKIVPHPDNPAGVNFTKVL